MIISLPKFFSVNFYIFFCIASLLVARGFNYPFIPIIKMMYIMYVIFVVYRYGITSNIGSTMLKGLLIAILLSLVGYAFMDTPPIGLLMRGIEMYFFPFGFFLIAQNSSEEEIALFYKRMFYAFMFTYIVGLYLYIESPTWYIDWRKEQLENWLGNSAQSYLDTYLNLSSFFYHPYFVGYTSIWATSYVLDKIRKSEKFPLIYIFCFLVIFVTSFLAQQRLCTLVNIMTICYYLFLEVKEQKFRLSYGVGLIILVGSIYIVILLNTYSVMFERYSTLLSGEILSDGRDIQWREAYSNFDNFIFGEGFNIAGHGAEDYHLPTIADGEIFKFFYEVGIVGCFFFYGFWYMTLRILKKNISIYIVEIPVIVGFVIAQYGANTFEMTNIIIIFWYCAGRIWNGNNQILTN